MEKAYILASYRTPGCRANKGRFKDMRPDDLAAVAIKAIVERTGVAPDLVDDVILGCAFPEAEQGMNVGRVAAMKAGLPAEVPGQTVNRFCSSGLQSIALAAERVMLGLADCIVAGGVESMSSVPMGGIKYSANPGLAEQWPEAYSSMGITAELVAEKYGIEREAMDAFGVESHRRAAEAIKSGRFADEIIPVEIEHTALVNGKIAKTTEVVEVDDGVRSSTTMDTLAGLRSAFKKGGPVTAGNSSQMTDGAAVSMVVSEKFLEKLDQDPMARFIAYAVKGVLPEIMGIGPVAAIPAVLEMASMSLDQIELIELNEAFAAQAIGCMRELGIENDRPNELGSGISLGHPIGCTGARQMVTGMNHMQRQGYNTGLFTMCIGGGMGMAMIVER